MILIQKKSSSKIFPEILISSSSLFFHVFKKEKKINEIFSGRNIETK